MAFQVPLGTSTDPPEPRGALTPPAMPPHLREQVVFLCEVLEGQVVVEDDQHCRGNAAGSACSLRTAPCPPQKDKSLPVPPVPAPTSPPAASLSPKGLLAVQEPSEKLSDESLDLPEHSPRPTQRGAALVFRQQTNPAGCNPRRSAGAP